MKRFVDKYGPLEQITFEQVQFDAGVNAGRMRLLMRCKCEKQTVPAYVDFGFVVMGSVVIEFQLPGTPEDQAPAGR